LLFAGCIPGEQGEKDSEIDEEKEEGAPEEEKEGEDKMELNWATPDFSVGRVQYRTFYSAAAQSEVSYHIYTPEIYDTETEQQFPVLYWLHGTGGIGGKKTSRDIEWLSNYFDSAIREGKIPPMLVVFPYGMINSMWVDSKDGSVPMETVVVKELVPHIDETFRTISSREGRLIEGFSMGGYGSARLGFKYHDVFGAVSILGGGPLQQVLTNENSPRAEAEEIEELMRKVYGDDVNYFKEQSPYEIAKRNADSIRVKTIIRQVVGEDDEVLENNLDFHAHLMQLEIPHEFKRLPGVTHNTPQYLNALGEDNWEFYNLVFGTGR